MRTNVTTAVAAALAMLPLVTPEAGAVVRGVGMHSLHSFHSRGHFHLAQHHFRFFRHHQAFGLWPWYGYYDVPPYTYDDSMTYSTPEVVVREPEPERAVGCQHSQQTFTVPSANGEKGQVTILRC